MTYTAKSAVLSNQDATPRVKIPAYQKGGVARHTRGNVATSAKTATETNAYVRVPVRARLISVMPKIGADMGNGSFKIGFFRVNGGVEIKSDAITAALSMLAAKDDLNCMDGPSNANKQLTIADWLATELGTAGATHDVEVDIVATVVTTSTGATTSHALEVEYVTDD